jgi:hypothetical protein
MGLESATFLSGLVATNPIGASDPKSQGDDHLRLIKSVLLATFPNMNAAMNATPAQLNLLVGLTALFQPVFKFKAAATDRASTTTLVDDPDMGATALAVGTYLYETHLNWRCVTSVTQQIKVAMAFSGTADIHVGTVQTDNTSGGGNTFTPIVDATLATGIGAGPITADKSYPFLIRAIIRVTVAGNLSVQWAQGVSNANATRLEKGSYFTVQRMV